MAKKTTTPKQLTLRSNPDEMLTSLPKDPQMSIDRIDELARRVLKGDILLPHFQRGFVWNNRQIIALLDSIGRGYPIGSMLLWQSSSQDLQSDNAIADLDITFPKPGYPVNYLLDGQQRLSVICGALFWRADYNPKSRWNIAYDLREQKFIHLDTLATPAIHLIRVNKLAEPAAFFQHVGTLSSLPNDEGPILQERASALFNRFKDYKIATMTLGDLPVEDVAPIFERINSTGTPLTVVDLMRAATWRPEFDLIDSIDEIRYEGEPKGFDEVDRLVLLRCISTAAGNDFDSASIAQLRNLSTAKLIQATIETKEAFKRAVDYLSTQLGIQSYELVPYANQVTILTELFRQLPHPSHQQYQAINQWFWKTSLSGYFAGWSTGAMKADLPVIVAFAKSQSDKLPVYLNPPAPEIWKVRGFSLRSAQSKLLALMLAYNKPLDLFDGKTLDTAKALARNNTKEFHHFFPRVYLRQKGITGTTANCPANFIMLSSSSNKAISGSPPSVYLKEIAERAGSNMRDRLESNLISDDAYEAALHDDYRAFLDARAATLHEFVISRTDWQQIGTTQTESLTDFSEAEAI